MKRLILSMGLSVVLSSFLCAEEMPLGEEYIKPLDFPKASLMGGYNIMRRFHGFAGSSLRHKLQDRYEGSLSFEAGLLKYLNAGCLFSTRAAKFRLDEPIGLRFGLFAKPFLPIGNRFAFFSRFVAGLAVELGFDPRAPSYYRHPYHEEEPSESDKAYMTEFDKIYGEQQYYGLPFGGFGSASVGIEFFPFSRFGLAAEFGIRATILRTQRDMPLVQSANSEEGSPRAFNYMLYELPAMLTLHAIF